MLAWLDLVLIGVLALSTIVGLWRGFITEVMSLAVWIAAFWAAAAFGASAATLFEATVDSEAARLFLGYAALFLLVLVAGGLVVWLVGRLVRATGLSGTDRVLGLGFGLLRGAALCCAMVLLLGFTALPREPWWQASRMLPAFVGGAEVLRGWLPEAVAAHIAFPEAAGPGAAGIDAALPSLPAADAPPGAPAGDPAATPEAGDADR